MYEYVMIISPSAACFSFLSSLLEWMMVPNQWIRLMEEDGIELNKEWLVDFTTFLVLLLPMHVVR